jgi:hypothetical protein
MLEASRVVELLLAHCTLSPAMDAGALYYMVTCLNHL